MINRIQRNTFCLLAFILILLIVGEPSARTRIGPTSERGGVLRQTSTPNITYTIRMTRPSTHLLEVEMRINWTTMPEKLELKMPVWTPGSYMVREYARHVQDFAARAGVAGAPAAWRKLNKNTWQIDTARARQVVVTYRVYANELTVRTNELNDEHAFWNNTALLMYPNGQLKVPSTITVVPFSSWKVATGLPRVPGQANTFRAENYDILYDSPFEVSDFREIIFNVRGRPHRYVFTGEGNYDLKRIAEDTSKIVEETYKIFGELPYTDYTFIVNLRGGGGLEHLNSTALQFDRFGFKNEARYRSFLGLVAHEYFHAFNVKRMRPDALGPFDYDNENYTKLLWVAEGATEYYSNMLLLRAGFLTVQEYLRGKAASIEQLQGQPGRFETSLEEASFDAWIKYYRQDENAVNNQISYYDKGEIVSMLLDMTIRSSSGGTRSLDDVMRSLYNDYFKRGRNFTPEDFQRVSEVAAGRSLEDFFTKYVRGEVEIDYNSIMTPLGLELNAVEANRDSAFIGADLVENGDRLTVRTIPADTPAYQQGLNTGDQIVAIDGYRASQSRLQNYIGERKPGDKVRLTIFRHDRMREITFTLGNDTRKQYSFSTVADPSESQRRLYRSYFNNDL